ncbi:MAG TPA: response regulator transcription factor [Acidovorax sp.]|nr:response regulator transcription factor [Acidovorax sp.]
MRIALLQSRPAAAECMLDALGTAGFVCRLFVDTPSLAKSLRTDTFDVLIVDWTATGLRPRTDIKTLCTLARGAPTLIVAHQYRESQLVSALTQGADSYMVNPYRSMELVSRVHALTRRAYPQSQQTLKTFEQYDFLDDRAVVVVAGSPVELTPREYELALFLFRNQRRVFSRAHIIEMVWRRATPAQSRSLDSTSSRLRNQLWLDGRYGFTLKSVYGIGYRLERLH